MIDGEGLTEELRGRAEQVGLCVRPLEGQEGLALDFHSKSRFRAASVIKAGIMSALLAAVANGKLKLGEEIVIESEDVVGGAGVIFELEPGHRFRLSELCRLMMVVSDNTASNACLRAVGQDNLNVFFAQRGYEAHIGRLFMHPVVDGQDNFMTPLSAIQILGDLYRGLGLNSELRDFAVGCLRRQQYREKIPLLLPEGILVGHKTGELDGLRHDAAVVESRRPYLVSIFTDGGSEPWLVDMAIAKLSARIFEENNGI